MCSDQGVIAFTSTRLFTTRFTRFSDPSAALEGVRVGAGIRAGGAGVQVGIWVWVLMRVQVRVGVSSTPNPAPSPGAEALVQDGVGIGAELHASCGRCCVLRQMPRTALPLHQSTALNPYPCTAIPLLSGIPTIHPFVPAPPLSPCVPDPCASCPCGRP